MGLIQQESIKIGLAQMSSVWLSKTKTTEKVISYLDQAKSKECDLVVFGEAILPGYPFWVELTDGARFESSVQKEIWAYYFENAINLDAGDLDSIASKAKELSLAIMLGTIERGMDRGAHSLYCTLVYIDKDGIIQNTHRKLMPTYEERLVWAQGDGFGLKVFPFEKFTLGALNCWENWMPLARTALYAKGEDLHIALWPGNLRNTEDITRFIAKESRSFVVSISGMFSKNDINPEVPHSNLIIENCPPVCADGGSCIAGPDGEWVLEPQVGSEGLFCAELNHKSVRRERQNFDPTGHYSRPDVLQIKLNSERNSTFTN